MQKFMLACCVLVLGLGLWSGPAAAQEDKSGRASPPATASCALPDGTTITVDYSSPRMKGRKIYGGIVPYGEVWRAVANEATTFVTKANLKVEGTDVPAGSYTMFAIPGTEKWTLIISKKTKEWGTNYPGPGEDLARIEMKVSKLPAPVENFTIAFEKGGAGCAMRLDWETTRASVAIEEKK